MGTPFSGKNAYAYLGGAAVTNLKGWDATITHSVIRGEPDISSGGWTYSGSGFLSCSGTIGFNLTSDDFNDIFDAVTAGTAISLYLYTARSSGIYLYGSFFLGNISVTAQTASMVSGTVAFESSGTVARQTTA